MFKPKYRITEYLLSLIERIAALTSKAEARKIRFSLLTRLQSEALERNAHSSTSIEGNRLSLAQVSALSRNKDIAADSAQKLEALNYIRALRWIIRKPQRKITVDSLLYLHSLIVKGLLPEEKTGQFKTKQNYVINAKKAVVFTPPSPKECPALVAQLLEWSGKSSKTHPIIVSAIFHHQFVTIHPFSDGNGRVARAAAQWVMYRNGFDPHHILSLDDFYARDRERYYSKIQQARDLDYDFTHWIEYVAEGILDTVKRTYSRMNKLSYAGRGKFVVTPKQEELINLLSAQGVLGAKELCAALEINRARLNQLILPLVRAKIILREGRARATRYYMGR